MGATTPTGNKGAARLCSRQTKRKTTAAGERRGSWSQSAAQTWRCLEDRGPKSCSSTVSSAHNDLHVQQRGCGFSADVTLFCLLLASVCSKYNTHTLTAGVSLLIFSINYKQQPAETHNIQPVSSQSTPPHTALAGCLADRLVKTQHVCLLSRLSSAPSCFCTSRLFPIFPSELFLVRLLQDVSDCSATAPQLSP